MMNQEDNQAIETLASAWTVETTVLSTRVAAAIGSTESTQPQESELLEEIRALRREMQGFRQMNALLHEEVLRLRLDLTPRRATRLAPYSPTEGLVRLS